jgi:hypothetical protein
MSAGGASGGEGELASGDEPITDTWTDTQWIGDKPEVAVAHHRLLASAGQLASRGQVLESVPQKMVEVWHSAMRTRADVWLRAADDDAALRVLLEMPQRALPKPTRGGGGGRVRERAMRGR